MLLNFISMKCSLFLPTLFCLNKAGPGSSIFMMIAMISIGIPRKRIPLSDITISKNLLKNFLYISVSQICNDHLSDHTKPKFISTKIIIAKTYLLFISLRIISFRPLTYLGSAAFMSLSLYGIPRASYFFTPIV